MMLSDLGLPRKLVSRHRGEGGERERDREAGLWNVECNTTCKISYVKPWKFARRASARHPPSAFVTFCRRPDSLGNVLKRVSGQQRGENSKKGGGRVKMVERRGEWGGGGGMRGRTGGEAARWRGETEGES